MNHNQLFQSLDILLKAGRPAYIQGPPGIGKTQGLEQFAASIGRKAFTESAAIMDPTDSKGLPGLDKETKTAKWFSPHIVHLLSAQPSIYFLDDLVVAPPLVQASLYRLMLDRCVGDVKLPDHVYVCAAGNRAIDAAAVNQMPTPMRNRLVHLELEVSVNDWCKWAVTHNVATSAIAFMRLRPELLHKFDKTKYAFPTPRSWEFVSDILNQNPPKALLFELVKGCIGEGAAVEFCAFYEMYLAMPSLDAILANPATAEVPTDPSILYAVSTALGRRATNNNMDAITTYGCRMPKEFEILTVSDAVQRDATVTKTRAFINWSINNHDVLM